MSCLFFLCLSHLPPSSMALTQSFQASTVFSAGSRGQKLKVCFCIWMSFTGSSLCFPLVPVQFDTSLSSGEKNNSACLRAKFLLELQLFRNLTSCSIGICTNDECTIKCGTRRVPNLVSGLLTVSGYSWSGCLLF